MEYIERDAAIAVIEEKQKELCPVGMYSRHAVYGSDREKFDAWEEIIETLEAIPAADVVKRKRGEWKRMPDPYGWFETIPVCSICGCTTKWRETYMFCPNCGARMVTEDV